MKKLLLAGAILALFCGQAFAADNTTVLNSTGGTVTMRCKDTGAGVLACTSTLADSSGTIIDPATKQDQHANIQYNGTTTPLTGSATYTGTARDTGIASGSLEPYAYFNGFFFADQAGTASIECSNDNSAWTTCSTSPLTASTPLILSVPVMFRYHRTKLVNGSSAEGTVMVNSSYTAG